MFPAASRQSTLPRLCRCRAAMVSPWLSPECTLKRRARERAKSYSPERADLRCTKSGVKIAPRMAAEHACTAPIRRGRVFAVLHVGDQYEHGRSMHRSHSPKTLAAQGSWHSRPARVSSCTQLCTRPASKPLHASVQGSARGQEPVRERPLPLSKNESNDVGSTHSTRSAARKKLTTKLPANRAKGTAD